jgi:hypothetical protein
VSVRASYRDDASFLIRLEKAIEADDKQDQKWRDETVAQVRNLAVRLLTVSDLGGAEEASELLLKETKKKK